MERSRYSSISKVAGYGLDNQGSIPGADINSFLHNHV